MGNFALRFRLGTTETMKHYMAFLFWHHNYSEQKLVDTFPEYFEKIPYTKHNYRWWSNY